MRRTHAVVLALVLLCAFASGLLLAPQAQATGNEPICYYVLCHGDFIVCCEGQPCCTLECHGDPPVCW